MTCNKFVSDLLDQIDSIKEESVNGTIEQRREGVDKILEVIRPFIDSGAEAMGISPDPDLSEQDEEFFARFVALVAAILTKTYIVLDDRVKLLRLQCLISMLASHENSDRQLRMVESIENDLKLIKGGLSDHCSAFEMIGLQLFIIGFSLGLKSGETHE